MAPGKVLVVYGSSTGNTKNVAEAIKGEMGEAVDHVKNITEIHPADLAQFEKVIVGVPTWHIGEIQEDWGAVLSEIEALNFQGKKVAVFGLGDGKGYPETYVDAMAELVEKFEKKGAKLVGMWPTDGYDFKKSKAIRDGKFLGLVIDVENQDHLSDKRVKAWVAQLQKEL
ncbi:flavodoxin [bacterium]|nr:flavodoxin [bacterium]